MGDHAFLQAQYPTRRCLRRQSATRAKPVMWLHVHKAMGSMFYQVARYNQEKVVEPSFNGNWWPYDTPSGDQRTRPSCEKRANYFRSTGATWGQIEHTLVD